MKIILLLLLQALRSAAITAQYTKYDGYNAVAFDGVAGTFAQRAIDCIALSTVKPWTNGVAYNEDSSSCVILTIASNQITITLQPKVGWTVYLKDLSDRPRMVFKVEAFQNSNQNGKNIGDAFLASGGSYTSTYSAAVASFDTSSSCRCTYRHPYIDQWNISEVTLQVVQDGRKVSSLIFDGTGKSKSNWFSKGNLIGAAPYSVGNMRVETFDNFRLNLGCWTCPDDPNLFQSAWNWVSGQTVEIGPCCRHMYANPSSGTFSAGCGGYYYVGTTNELNSCCSIGNNNYPAILYSQVKKGGASNTIATGYADYMTVWVKIKTQVVFTS